MRAASVTWGSSKTRGSPSAIFIVVAGLPTLFHGGTGELKALGRRLISARLVLQLHEGGNSDARFLLQELHLRALFEDVGQLIQEFYQREPEFPLFLYCSSVMFNRVAPWISRDRE